ncbi:uridylate kinase [Mycobacterium eburneum]|nr:uridylate kinase [Mycobacterium eburneum]
MGAPPGAQRRGGRSDEEERRMTPAPATMQSEAMRRSGA